MEGANDTDTSNQNATVKLISKDNQHFEIPLQVAKLSKMVEETIQCDEEGEIEDSDSSKYTEIQLPNVRSSCLAKIIEFCNHYATVEALHPIETPLKGCLLSEIVSQPWYRDFILNVELTMIFEIVTAANYMDIKPLLDLSCLVVSISLMGKSASEIGSILNIPKITPEEEVIARREHPWIYKDT